MPGALACTGDSVARRDSSDPVPDPEGESRGAVAKCRWLLEACLNRVECRAESIALCLLNDLSGLIGPSSRLADQAITRGLNFRPLRAGAHQARADLHKYTVRVERGRWYVTQLNASVPQALGHLFHKVAACAPA